jgi:hypothetical protein
VPQITNGTWTNGVLLVNPTQSNTLNLSTFSTYATGGVAGHESAEVDTDNDSFQQQIVSQPVLGLTVSATPMTSFTFPANTLTAGKVYRLHVQFDTVTTLDTTSVSQNIAVGIFQNDLEVWVAAVAPATVVPAAPVITAQPQDTAVAAGANATFTASVNYNNGQILGANISWYYNGGELDIQQNDPRYLVNFNGNSVSLTVKNVTAADVGKYSLHYVTIAGQVQTNEANLTLAQVSPPTVTGNPLPQTVAAGSSAVFGVQYTGTSPMTFQWQKDGTPVADATNATLWLQNTSAANAGNYSVKLTNSAGTETSGNAALQVLNTNDPGRLINLSVLASIASSETMTIGTHIQGTDTSPTTPVLIRAIGPSLQAFHITTYVPDPTLALFGPGSVALGTNDDWGGTQALRDIFVVTGAFGLASSSSKDAAMLATSLAPGDYSAQIKGANGGGTVIAELYDGTPTPYDPSRNRLINVSVRKNIAGGDILTLGFTIGGSTAKTVLIRGIGPGLAAFTIQDFIVDPNLTLYQQGGPQLASNDNWGGSGVLRQAMRTVFAFGIADSNSADAMLLITLPPGGYSAQIKGANNGGGTALVEVYDVP